jgi:hypothetical protein
MENNEKLWLKYGFTYKDNMYCVFIGNKSVDGPEIYAICGVGISDYLSDAIMAARKSAANHIGIDEPDIVLSPASPKIKWKAFEYKENKCS